MEEIIMLWIVLVIILLLIFWLIGMYNGLVQSRNKVKNA